MFTSFKRIFKSGWQGFFRDFGLAAATVFILILVISLVTSLFLFQEFSQFLISSLEKKADVSIYFKEGIPENDVLQIKEELTKIPEIKEIRYISKEKALSDFTQKHKDNSVLMLALEEVGKNPFLASLNIVASETGHYQTVVNFFEKLGRKNLVEKIDYYQRKPIIERIFSLTNTFNKVFFGLSVILIVIAILVTFNTIRLAIYNYREEIKIQRLVGASNWFIRGPFLVQGIISGVFAALICLLIFSLICWILTPKIENFFPDWNIFQFFVNNFRVIVLIQFATGIFLGVISSFLATKRYLKV